MKRQEMKKYTKVKLKNHYAASRLVEHWLLKLPEIIFPITLLPYKVDSDPLSLDELFNLRNTM